ARDKRIEGMVELGKRTPGWVDKLRSKDKLTVEELREFALELQADPATAKLAVDGFEARLHESMKASGGDPQTDALMCIDMIRNLDPARASKLEEIYPALS